MDHQQLLARIQTELQRRFRIAGLGAVKRVEAELELAEGYFRDQRRPGHRRVDLKVLFKTLDVLGVDPADFFAAVFGGVDLVEAFQAEAMVLKGRSKRQPRILALEQKRAAVIDAESAAAELDELIEVMEDQDPQLLQRRANRLMSRVAEDRVPEVLAIYAAACRRCGRYDDSQIVLARALSLAGASQRSHLIGGLLQLCAALVAAHGQYRRALGFLERAILSHVADGDLRGAGQAMVRQGECWQNLERPSAARAAFSRALEYLPADSGRRDVSRYRRAALAGLAEVSRGARGGAVPGSDREAHPGETETAAAAGSRR